MRFMFFALLACADKSGDSAPASTDSGTDGTGADTGPGTETGTDTGTDTGTTITPIVPTIAWFDDVAPYDLTPDGSTALLQSMLTIDGELLLLDTETGVLSSVTTLGDATMNMATGISADLKISALHGVPVEAGVWSPSAGWVDLTSPFAVGCDVNIGGGFDISDDGAVVVGLMWDGCVPAAFRWSEAGGMQVLELLGEGSSTTPTNRATVVSGDGQVAAGFAENGNLDRTPARWAADGSGEFLAPLDRDQTGEVLSIDGDGSTLGVLRGNDGYVWTADGGFVSLGRLPNALPTDPVYPNTMTHDGARIFGGVGSEYFTVPSAFVWTADQGIRSVQEVATAAGLTIDAGYWLTSVLAVSDDGSVLLGRAFDAEFNPKTFVLRVPAETWGE